MPETIIGAVPDGWRLTSLGDLCRQDGGGIQTGPFGSQLHASDYVPVGIPSVMPQNIGDNFLVEEGIARISSEDAQRLSRYLLREGDIVYSRRGDVERRALVRRHQDGWLCGTGCLRVRLAGSADPKFVSYYLGHPEVRSWIVRHAVGATMPNLNTAILSNVPVVVPPAHLQQAVGEVLGALDDKIAVNERIAGCSDELRRALFVESTTGNGVQGRPLTSFADFVNGRAFTKGATGTGRMVVRIAEINSGPGGSTVYNDIEVPEQHLARPGDVLFAWSGSLTVARWCRSEAIINQHIFKVIPRVGVPAWLAYELVMSKLVEFKSIATDKATTMGHIQRRHLEEPVVAPTADGIRRLHDQLGPLWDRALAAEQESLALIEMRDALLPGLLSGAIRVRDAEKAVEDAI